LRFPNPTLLYFSIEILSFLYFTVQGKPDLFSRLTPDKFIFQ